MYNYIIHGPKFEYKNISYIIIIILFLYLHWEHSQEDPQPLNLWIVHLQSPRNLSEVRKS